MSLNHVIEMGRICTDLTVRYTQSQKPVTSFRIAVDDGYGEKKKTYFISCVAWERNSGLLTNHFNKGDPIIVEGKLTMREWTDKQGSKRTEAEVVADNIYFAGSKQRGENRTTEAPVDVSAADWEDLDDELPWEN